MEPSSGGGHANEPKNEIIGGEDPTDSRQQPKQGLLLVGDNEVSGSMDIKLDSEELQHIMFIPECIADILLEKTDIASAYR